MSKLSLNRRDFLSSAAFAGVGTIGGGALLSSCNGGGTAPKEPVLTPLLPKEQWNIPASLPDKAKDGTPLKAGLIGCGGRGSGAAENFLNAAPNVSIVALADAFQDRLDGCRKMLAEKYQQKIEDSKCYVGFDAYKKLLESGGVDMVIVATPPAFRPVHFKAAVEANKHCFLEKPVAVDPVGAKLVMTTSKQAVAQGLVVITGTQRHHERSYIEGYKQVQSGLIGDIVGANVYWNGSVPWYKTKQPGWTDMEAMLRDWVNWTWLSGDHIVEQHVHNIDVFTWFSGMKPINAVAFGSRIRRVTGDQYDNFSVNFLYPNGIRIHSMCRQISGCKDDVREEIHGTKGIWYSNGVIKDLSGKEVWKYDREKEKAEFKQTDPYTLEHVNWVNLIRDKKPFSQAEETAISTMCAVMGRTSAYTGQEVTWDQMMASTESIVPENPVFGPSELYKHVAPLPGKA